MLDQFRKVRQARLAVIEDARVWRVEPVCPFYRCRR